MTLSDLRKLTVRKQVRIRFRIANGMDCVINEHGVAQVPELRRIADFNLEQAIGVGPDAEDSRANFRPHAYERANHESALNEG